MKKTLSIDSFFSTYPSFEEIIDVLNKELKEYELLDTKNLKIKYKDLLYKVEVVLLRGSYQIYIVEDK